MVGNAILNELKSRGYSNLITAPHAKLDLTRQNNVEKWFSENTPDFVFLCAARVGGIGANVSQPAQFLYDNIMIQSNVIHSSYLNGVKKLLFLGSSCIYPRLSKQPMKEEYMLTGHLEPTNEGYAVAKIAGLKMCEYYRKQYSFNAITIVPPNLYGPGDNFSLEGSHVIAALLRRFHTAKMESSDSVTIWGTGKARREFMFVSDLATVAVDLVDTYNGEEFLNVGTGIDYTILELAEKIRNVVGYDGDIVFDTSEPDGMPRKVMDLSKLEEFYDLESINLEEGLKLTYDWFCKNIAIE